MHPQDNVIVALQDLKAGDSVTLLGDTFQVTEDVPAKHKFAERTFAAGDSIIMYGVLVGKALSGIPAGTRISRQNISHDSGDYTVGERKLSWTVPDITDFAERTFQGFHRKDGKVGTRNYWLVIPLVFCENRNVKVIREAMLSQLGYVSGKEFSVDINPLVQLYRTGATADAILQTPVIREAEDLARQRLFPQVDGIKFLIHEGGCGGTRQDAEALTRLLAGYVANANVAGATVLSLGCQNAQYQLMEQALQEFAPDLGKPVYMLEQQKSLSERDFIAEAVKHTFVGLMEANKCQRQPAPLSKLTLGLECGGSDGFSGISANPALGYASDLLVALGATTVLSEFPELNGVEQELINRCVDDRTAHKFEDIMRAYSSRAKAVGSGFDMNPSPGNIRDGLITDAMKSAGAAKKGGTSPVTDVLDYTEQIHKPGLNLLCTPGNDVESTTAMVGSGATIIVFTTGLGTPTGNPIAPTVKMASNTVLANRMADIIDVNAGTIISGEDTIESKGRELLEYIIKVASGDAIPHAERLGQDDFIPWKRGVSL